MTGTWAGLWEVLYNGEQNRLILELHETGTQLTGTMTTIGHKMKIEGSLAGTHFEFFDVKRRSVAQLTGDVAGDELHLKRDGKSFTAKPAKPGDGYPTFKYITPPALHDVPSDGLARTPPTNVKFHDGLYTATIVPHGVLMLRVSSKN